ncbi:MAG TPA: discoidin domain-containing protein, partial [Fimbriimonadaceae bacterium]|nr:discoidin domain-containing protein [Fimbriimonadaceae bacterium]
KPGQKVSWRVNVRNYGDLDSQSQTLTVDQAGRQVVSQKRSGTIAVGGTEVMTFEAPWPDTPLNPSLALMSLRVATAEQDRNPSDNGLAVYPDGLPVYVHGAEPSQVQKAVTDLNQRVFPTSKFGAWPDGCVERLRVVTSPEGAIDVPAEDGDVEQDLLRAIVGLPAVLLRPYADKPPTLAAVTVPAFVSKAGQVGLLPDTRDDVLVPQGLAIPDSAATSLAFGDIPMVEHRMLSRSETTILNTLVGKTGADRQLPWQMTPNAIFFRVITPDGKPPRGARLDVYQLVGGAFGGVPVFSSALPPDGTVLMPPRAGGAFGKSNPYGDLQTDGSNGWLLAVVSAHDTNASSWIPVWQLWDEAARGNDAAGYVELRMQLSSGELDRTQNIALNKIVTDEAKRFPAQLNALVDGKVQTSLTFENEPEGYWIEVDMGRDLPIGEVSLTFDGMPWKQFRIVTYKTAQNPEDGQVWAEEANGPANTTLDKTDDGHTILRYLSTSVRSRFLRIVPLSPEAVKLSEITVVPLKTD